MIRLARPEDAAAVGALGRRTFFDTFVTGFGIPYPEADLNAFLDAIEQQEARRMGNLLSLIATGSQGNQAALQRMMRALSC